MSTDAMTFACADSLAIIMNFEFSCDTLHYEGLIFSNSLNRRETKVLSFKNLKNIQNSFFTCSRRPWSQQRNGRAVRHWWSQMALPISSVTRPSARRFAIRAMCQWERKQSSARMASGEALCLSVQHALRQLRCHLIRYLISRHGVISVIISLMNHW